MRDKHTEIIKHIVEHFASLTQHGHEDQALKYLTAQLNHFPENQRAKIYGLIFERSIDRNIEKTDLENTAKEILIELLELTDDQEQLLKVKKKIADSQ